MLFQLFRVLIYFCSIYTLTLNAKETDSRLAMYTMEQVPYGYIEKSGKTSGVLFEILEQIIVESGLEKKSGINNKLVPTKRLVLELAGKENACSLLADDSNTRKHFDLVEPIGYEFQAGVLPRSGIILVNYESLKNKTLAVPLGIEFFEKFDTDKELLKMTPPTYLHGVRMLKAGRVDAVVGPISNLLYLAKAEGMFQLDFGPPLVFRRSHVHLACSTGLDKGIRRVLKQAVINLKLAGSIQKTLDKYFLPIRYSKLE
jgi:polar amino acid transport system substrate-binding protein